MITAISDNFDRADSDTLGSGWTEQLGDIDIASNRAKSTNEAIATWTQDTTIHSDVELQADVEGTVSVGGVALIARFTDINNFLYCIINTFSQTVKIYKMVAGSATELGSYTGGYSNGTVYTLKFICQGNTLKAYVGGTERISITDRSINVPGQVGLYGDSANRFWNNFTCKIPERIASRPPPYR